MKKSTKKLIAVITVLMIAIVSCPFAIFADTATDKTVESIEYTPVREVTLIENLNGIWENEIFIYDFTPTPNDTITVTYTDGSNDVYTYDRWDYVWYDWDYNEIDADHLKIDAEQPQKTNPWTVGADNYVTISYYDAEYKLPVNVIENPVDSIEYIPEEKTVDIENNTGYWDERYNEETGSVEKYFRYEFMSKTGDSLKVYFKDGSETVYTRDRWEKWYNEDGEELLYNYFEVEPEENQDSNPWTVGENYAVVRYCDVECKVAVTVQANPIKAINYISASEKTVVEYIDGRWYNESDEETGETKEYFGYYFEPSDNDKLIIEYSSGVTTEYTFDLYDYGWYDSTGERLETTHLLIDSDYSENGEHWSEGLNYALISYYNITCKVPVTVLPNPLEAIEYTPAKDFVFVEGEGGHYDPEIENYRYDFNPNDGDKLTAYFDDGKVIVYTYDALDDNWYDENGEEPFASIGTLQDSSQYDRPWKVGQDNYAEITLYGYSCQVPVTIVAKDSGSDDSQDNKPSGNNQIISGANSTWTTNSSEGLTFKSDAEFDEFVKVLVDGKEVDSSYYTVKEGSTIVTLKPEFLATLSQGKHTISIVSESGTAETTFTVSNTTNTTTDNSVSNDKNSTNSSGKDLVSPVTGFEGGLLIVSIVTVISCFSVVLMLAIRKKKINNN